MADPIIYFPYKEYDSLKGKLHQHAVDYFDELAKKANVDEMANAKHASDYEKHKEVENKHNSSLAGKKTLKGFVIAGIVISFILAFIFVFVGFAFPPLWILVLVFVLAGAGLIVLLAVKISKDIKKGNLVASELAKESERLLKICLDDMAPLTSLFDYNIPVHLMDDVIDILRMDENVNNVRLSDLIHNYGFVLESDKNGTTLGAMSGEMLNNPFILVKSCDRRMVDKTYTGSRVVTVRVTRMDSKGHMYVTTETQTLSASVTHPAPSYTYNTNLFYACEAASNLSFSRTPSIGHTMDEKGREKYIRNQIKGIVKKADKAIRKGQSGFTPTGNDAFDVFFGANNRNNEVEFRFLYNALAQQNTLALITNPKPFGDDFNFIKKKKINIISSRHSAAFNYFVNPTDYVHYSFEKCRDKFINYIDDYFKNLYFDFAPLLSIPEYQMYKGHPIKESKYDSNYSMIEKEVMANKLNILEFSPEGASAGQKVTLSYLKSEKVGDIDVVVVNSSSYMTFPETDHVPRVARDGVMHIVPVNWTRYEEVNDQKAFALYHADITLQEFKEKIKDLPEEYINKDNMHFERGLFAFTYKRMPDLLLSEKLNSLFKK